MSYHDDPLTEAELHDVFVAIVDWGIALVAVLVGAAVFLPY